MVRIKRALLSVTDKTGLPDFARGLYELGIPLIASGKTATAIREAEIPVAEVADVTGFPEMMDGRLKTLHPKIHGGILADRGKESHMRSAEEHGIEMIDLVVVNLYRFKEAVKAGLSADEIVEKIDIGGPTLIRSAAKNHKHVLIVVDPGDYAFVLDMLRNRDSVPLEERRRLAGKAFEMTSDYDTAIKAWFGTLDGSGA